MAGQMADYLETAALNHFLKGSSYTQPTHIYVALFTANPNGGGGGTEVTGNAYARTICDAWTFTGVEPASASNTSTVTFPTATPAGWGTIIAWALFDLLTGGNMLYYQASAFSQSIPANGIAEFLAGALVITQT